MSPETPGPGDSAPLPQTTSPEGPKPTEQIPPGLLKLEDIPADQRNEAVAQHLRKVNECYEAQARTADPEAIRLLVKEQYGELDLSDLQDICQHMDDLIALANGEGSKTEPTDTASTPIPSVSGEREEPISDVADMVEPQAEALETVSDRQNRLGQFVKEHFSDVCPAEYQDAAVEECTFFEDELRIAFGDEAIKLEPADAADATLREKVIGAIPKIEENAQTIAGLEAQREDKAAEQVEVAERAEKTTAEREALENAHPEIPTDKAEGDVMLASLKTENTALRAKDNKEKAKLADVTEKLETEKEDLGKVQEEFEKLRSEKGTIGALKALLTGEEALKSPSSRAVIRRVLDTAQKLVNAIPGKSAVVERYIDQSQVNLAASAPAQVFAGFLAMADSSDEFTAEEMEQIRRVLHSSAPAGSAAELQDALKKGRGTKEITEIQRVEEPPGSGNFVEKEVVVGTEAIPFTKSEPYLLSTSPLVTLYPEPANGTTYRVNAAITNASDVSFLVDIPEEGTIPEEAINNQVNKHLLRATLQNSNLRGVMDFWFGQGDSTLGAGGNTNLAAFGGNDMSHAITEMFLGKNTLQGNRFLTASELGQISHDARWLVPGGDFGGTNKVDGKGAAKMMTALFGENQTDITDNMARAHQFINSGGAEAPSFEGLYRSMYPQDTNYTRLTSIIGEKAVAELDLPDLDAPPKAA